MNNQNINPNNHMSNQPLCKKLYYCAFDVALAFLNANACLHLLYGKKDLSTDHHLSHICSAI
jgi:hypothetical protein